MQKNENMLHTQKKKKNKKQPMGNILTDLKFWIQ